MINTNELEAGNWVSIRRSRETTPEYYQVTDSNDALLHTSDNVEPISLTVEWIMKLGFRAYKESSGYPYYTRLQLSWGIIPGERDEWMIFDTNKFPQATPILYVHQLQNLYFYSTGERI